MDKCRYLVERRAAADPAIEREEGMLSRAAWDRKLDTVRLLLDIGFDPHAGGVHESTPLDRAAFKGSTT